MAMTLQDMQKLIGFKVTKVGTYVDGFWLELENGQKTFIDTTE